MPRSPNRGTAHTGSSSIVTTIRAGLLKAHTHRGNLPGPRMLVFNLATDFATQLPSEGEMERWVLPAMSSGQRVTLLPNRWGLLAAIASMLAVPVWAEVGAAADASDTEAFRQAPLLDTFGKWQIHKGLVNNTYLLIGESTGTGAGHFWLHCDQNHLMTVAVPLAERDGQERLRSHAVTIRADTGAERAMDLIVFESFVAVAIDYEGGHNNKVADFIDVLRAAKETVTISYANKTFEYDVTQLPTAEARFLQLCNRT